MTTERQADTRLGKKLKKKLEDLKSRVALSAAATDQTALVESSPPPADETVRGGQHTPGHAECNVQPPRYTTQTSSPPLTPLCADLAPPLSVEAAPTPLESFFAPCFTMPHLDYPTELLGHPPVHPHEHHVYEDSSPFSAGYEAMTGSRRSALG